MKQKRVLSAVLCLSLAAGIMASCGENAEDPKTTDTQTETESVTADPEKADPLAEPELPEKKYGGYEFKILTNVEGWGIYNNEHIVVEAETGEVLNDAIYSRNRHAEEKFDIKLVETISNTIPTDIQKTVLAGDDAYDLIVPTNEPKLGTEFLVDFNSLDYISPDKPWWNQNYIEAKSVNGKLTTAVSSLMITHMDSVLGMLFNKKLTEDYKLPDIYELVRKNEWTLPKYFELSKGATRDLNGDSEYNDDDQYSFVGLDGIQRLGSGVQLITVKKDKNDIPKLSIDSSVIDRITKLRDLAAQHKDEIYNARNVSKTVFAFFINDQAMFYVHGLGSIQQFRDMKHDFGVIPTPKLDELQENYFIAPDCTKCLAIPKTAKDLERTAMVLEYMSWDGYTTLRPKYYESMLQAKYLRDEESVEMMDKYIYTNIGFDSSSCSTKLTSTIASALNDSNDVASLFESNRTVIESEIEETVSLYQ